MALFTWDGSFSVNIPSIDAQHKKLVGIVNELHAALQNGNSDEVLNNIFKELLDYTHEHFAYEEKLFDKYFYAGSTEHKRKHKYIFDEVNRMKTKGSQKTIVSLELMTFLRKWLTKHIKVTDKEYSEYLLSKGVR